MTASGQSGRICPLREWGRLALYLRSQAACSRLNVAPRRPPLSPLFDALAASLALDEARGLVLVEGQDVNLLLHGWAYGNKAPKSLYALSSANEVQIDALHWAKAMEGKCFLERVEDDGACRINLADYPLLDRFDEPALLFGSPNNWGHWIADHLPLLAYLDLFPGLGERRLVMHSLSPMHRESLDLLGIDASRIIEATSYPVLKGRHVFSQLAVPGRVPLSFGYAYIRQRLYAHLEQKSGGPDRVYLTRAKLAPRHRVYNEEEVQDLLRRRGFAIVHPETLSVRETLQLLQGADILIGQLGAGFGNAPLARPDAALIYLLPEDLLRGIGRDPGARHEMAYYAALEGHVIAVPGAFDRPEQAAYAQEHRLDALDRPLRYELGAIDMAILEAEKALRLRQRGIL
jgi:capsular polysaccharide biosynthesis protein